jgi:molecular chaperone GrpE
MENNQNDTVEELDDENISDIPTDTVQLQQDLEAAKSKAEENLNGWKRALADFENYKKRTEVEKKEVVEFAKEVTVAKLLPTLDTLEQALKHMPVVSGQWLVGSEDAKGFEKQYANWQTGINGLVMQLDKVLEEMGVKKIESVGKKFDPHFHEAVRELETEAEDGTVIEEFQSGFELNGKVIRPSQVVISKKKQVA